MSTLINPTTGEELESSPASATLEETDAAIARAHDAFPAWRGSLFTGSLKDRKLVRLTLEGDKVTGEEHLLAGRGQRVRDVRQGGDGLLYIVTDETNGELWKLVPR